MRGISWMHLSIGAMAFGTGGVFLAGFMLFLCLVALTVGALLFYFVRWIVRGLWPKRIKVNECSPELLAYWAENAKYLKRT